jgi:hypothetical protein
MLDNMKIILKEVTDLERGMKRNGDREGLKKLQSIKKRIKALILEEMQK